MFGNGTTPEGLDVEWKYRDRSIQHTCPRHAAWDPQPPCPCNLNPFTYESFPQTMNQVLVQSWTVWVINYMYSTSLPTP